MWGSLHVCFLDRWSASFDAYGTPRACGSHRRCRTARAARLCTTRARVTAGSTVRAPSTGALPAAASYCIGVAALTPPPTQHRFPILPAGGEVRLLETLAHITRDLMQNRMGLRQGLEKEAEVRAQFNKVKP